MDAFIRVAGMAAVIFGLLLFWPLVLIAALGIGLFWIIGAWATK